MNLYFKSRYYCNIQSIFVREAINPVLIGHYPFAHISAFKSTSIYLNRDLYDSSRLSLWNSHLSLYWSWANISLIRHYKLSILPGYLPGITNHPFMLE